MRGLDPRIHVFLSVEPHVWMAGHRQGKRRRSSNGYAGPDGQAFCPTGKSPRHLASLSSPTSKNFPLSPSGKTSLEASVVPYSQKGRFAIVTNVGAGCDGRVGIKRRMVPAADGEVVRS
jgi:hypothetical protein